MADAETSTILQETLTLPKSSGRKADVTLTGSCITWVTENKKLNVKVSLCDVLIARSENITSSSSSEEGSLIIHYGKHTVGKREHLLSEQSVTFHSTISVCSQWRDTVNDLLLKKFPYRPKHLLVFVNPVSGKKSGPKVYRSRAEPLFSVCGVSTEVIVTTHAHHTEEVISAYDVTKTDGIVTVGGDGTYAEAVNGLARRAMKEANQDEDDPDVDLKRLALPVGIIPTGTGDGIVATSNTTKDVTTAILLIILGTRIPKDVATVHQGRKFMVYSILLTGTGLFSETIRKAESNRNMGRIRYAYGLIYAIAKHKAIEVEVDYLPCVDSGKETVAKSEESGEVTNEQCSGKSGESGEVTDEQCSGWHHKNGSFVRVDDFMYSIQLSPTPLRHTLGDGLLRLTFIKPCGRISHGLYMKRSMDGETEAASSSVGEEIKVKEYRVRAAGEWRACPKSRIINVDGEIINLAEPDFSVKCHKGVSELYAWPLDNNEETSGAGCSAEGACSLDTRVK